MTPWILLAVVLLIGGLLAQVLIPRIGERRIERRLTEGGGEAFVALDALPATRLLLRRGDRIVVRGRRIAIGMSRDGGGLAALDGFDHVDIVLGEFTTGPFEVSSFELLRSGGGSYVLRSEATTSGTALASYGGDALGAVAPLLGLVARQAPLGSRGIPLSVEVELRSEAGLLSVASGGGTIAGYPAGPIATMIAGAVARRLEIAY